MGAKITKDLIGMTVVLVVVFLVLTNSTGFARTVGALAKGYSQTVKTLQGRG